MKAKRNTRPLQPGEAADLQSVEPGQPIVSITCPCCGASLEVEHGDEEGQIGTVWTPPPATAPVPGPCQRDRHRRMHRYAAALERLRAWVDSDYARAECLSPNEADDLITRVKAILERVKIERDKARTERDAARKRLRHWMMADSDSHGNTRRLAYAQDALLHLESILGSVSIECDRCGNVAAIADEDLCFADGQRVDLARRIRS